jgi:D-alanyl-D-alanine-carboxypeptidase/D-alanyl-D-alanine-endopeptidase
VIDRADARGHHALVVGVLRAGEARFEGVEADEHARFEIGSITKAFTGVLLGDMVARGEAALDELLSKLLPPDELAPGWRGREPTLLELATHRSGLANTPRGFFRRELGFASGLSSRNPWAGLSSGAYRTAVARTSPRRAPGGRMRYSSLGFALLGEALARRAGTTWAALVEERVCWPLGLESTSVDGPLLQGHSRRGKPRPPLEDAMAPAGALRSTAADMLRFLRACAEPPAEPPGPGIRLATREHFRPSKRLAVGLGWLIASPRGRPPTTWHNGGTWGFRSFAGFRDGPVAVVVLANTARSVDRLGFRLLDRT